MRRYAVRFLVAILTFATGVTLSLVLGLFKPQDISIAPTWSRRPPCPKKFRVARPAFLTVDSQHADPLQFVYLGTSSDSYYEREARMQFSVVNRSEKTVSGYLIRANEIWGANGKGSEKSIEFTSFEVLQPGEWRSTTLPRDAEGFSVRVARVNFQDGSTWINPRELK